MKSNVVYDNVAVQSAFGVLCLVCCIAVLSKADSCNVRCEGFGLASSHLGQIKCFADKNPGFGESKNSNKKKCNVFNPESLYTGKKLLGR